MKRENTGKIIHDHLVKNIDDTSKVTPMDLAEARTKEYIDGLVEAAEDGRKTFSQDFYIDVQKKEETLFMKKAYRHYFICKQACPTPTHDQDLFKYNKTSDQIEYMWSVPDKGACKEMIENALKLPDAQKELLQFVLDFRDGTLKKKAMMINGEL